MSTSRKPTGARPGRPLLSMSTRRLATVIRTALVVLTAFAASMVAPGPVSAAPAPVHHDSVLFARGEAGYFCYRIPTMVKAKNGDLLAIVEGRKDNCQDDTDIDLVMKRSTNNGVSWGPVQVIAGLGTSTLGNPTPVVDMASGRISILANSNARADCPPCQRDVWLVMSMNNGSSWSTPVRQPHLQRPEWDRFIANGPVHGIQPKRGPHAGRLVISSMHEMSNGTELPIYGAHLYLSDDGGATWRIGALIEDFEGRTKPTESTVVELTDGRLYISSREVAAASPGVRAFAHSSDSGESFDGYFETLPDFSTVQVQASLLRLTATDEGDARNRIMISTVAHPGAREVMQIRSSFDEGATWQNTDQGKVFWWGPTAYSDMAELGTNPTAGIMVGLAYEAGTANPYETIRFSRFNEAFLSTPNGTPPGYPPPAPGPTTPDTGPAANTAYVRGGAAVTDGRYGRGLAFDKVDDGVEVPYTPAVDLDDGDFTILCWFKYSATTGTYAITWAYRVGAAPQLWLRAEPGSNRIRAFLGTGLGTALDISSTRAYNDGAWHHVAITRQDRQATMYIDGASAATGQTPPGSVTNGKQFGVDGLYVGQSPDGSSRFSGTLDEFKIYGRALTLDEINRIRTRNVPIRDDLRISLRFEAISPRA